MAKTLFKNLIYLALFAFSTLLNAQPYLGNDTIKNVTCFGLNNGSISYHVDGSGPIHYVWSNGDSGYATGACTYAVNLNNPGAALTQFQVQVNVNLAAGMNADFSNIVFTDSVGNQFPFWLKDFPTASAAVFWVRVPFIPAGNSVFYLSFCGNSTSSASNGNNTFEFFDNFDNGDFTAWTSSCELPISGASCSAQASSQYYSAPYSANLVASSTCFIPPYSGSGAIISRTVTLVNDSLVIDYNDSVQATLMGYCSGATGTHNEVLVDGNSLGNGAGASYSGSSSGLCGTGSSQWTDETSLPFAVTSGSATIELNTYSGDCDDGSGWFDDVRIRKYVTYPPLVTLDTTGQLFLDSLSAGSYTIQMTDANGIVGSVTLQVTQANALVATPDSSNITCFGAQNGSAWVILSGGTQPINFSWSDGYQTDTISGLSPGVYSVTVSDSNSCSVTASVQIMSATSLLNLVLNDSNVLCFGASSGSAWAKAGGGQGPYLYSWSNGATSDTITNLPAAKYIVTVQDVYGCTLSDNITLSQPDSALSATIGSLPDLCAGNAQGELWANAEGGTVPYSFSWSNSAAADTIMNLGAGNYAVTVTDSNQCTAAANYTLAAATQSISIVASTQQPACYNGTDGVIAVNVTGGTLPYSFNWVPQVSYNDSAFNVGAGRYVVNGTDSNNCPFADTVTLSQPAAISYTNTIINAPCQGDSASNAIYILATGGTGSLSFTWNPSVSNSDSANNLSPDTYIIAISDSNNCSVTDSVVIIQTSALHDSITQINNTCVANDGQVQVFVQGGTAPYLFTFSNGIQNTTGIDDSLPPGTISFSVTDSSGCSPLVDSAILPSADTFSITVTPNVAEVNLGQSLQISTSSSQVSLAYQWTPAADLSCYDCPNPIFSGNNSQNYQLIATNMMGCSATANISITVNPAYNLFFPSAFSPNGDGNNDTWQILGNIEAVKYVSVAIFNRIGEKVYESNNIEAGWDGRYKGQFVLPGVYAYVAKIVWIDDYSENIRKGTITVAR